MRVPLTTLLALAAVSATRPSVAAFAPDFAIEVGAKALLQLESTRQQLQPPAFPALAFPEGRPGKRVLAIVPGHGDERRTPVLAASLAVARQAFPNFLCVVFSYRSEHEFPLEVGVPECHIVRGAGVNLEFLKRLPDTLVNASDLVFMLHNDVQLNGSESAVNLSEISQIMERNSLDMASPALLHTNWKYQVPQKHLDGKVGRRVPVVEFQANLFTRDAFKVLQELVRPDLSKCYGYANIFPAFFEAARKREPRFGLIDTMVAVHKQGEGMPTTNKACDAMLSGKSLIETFRSHLTYPQAPHAPTKCWNPTCTALWSHYEVEGIFPVPFDERLMGATLEQLGPV